LSVVKVFGCIAGRNGTRLRRKEELELSDGFKAAFAENSSIGGGANAEGWIRLDFDTAPFGMDADRNELIRA